MKTAHKHGHADDGHDHKAAPMVEEITDYEVLEIAVRELAIEHGLFTADDDRRFTEWAESVGPAAGSRLVAKAWTDPAFKARLMEDGTKACKEIGVDWAEPSTENWTEEQLATIVARDCMIGVALPRPGRTADVHPVHKARRPVHSAPQHGKAAG
jgi:hypothetical protein